VFGSGRGSVPVNKGSRGAPKRLPQIDNPVLIGVAGLGALGAGLALRSLRPTHRAGRSERIRMLVSDAVQRGVEVHGPETAPASVDVQVHEAFGKPPLVSIDVRMERTVDEEVAQDLLDRAVRAAWHNPELAPVAVRARVLLPVHKERDPSAKVLVDMTALGCEDETARPADLYARYGSPASDPNWRP
jgi:hypothetical protein